MSKARVALTAAWDVASVRIVQPLYRASRLARPSLRRAVLAYREGMHFRLEAFYWDEEQKREWILERLREAVRRAYRETMFYRERFTQIGFDPYTDFGFDDFARLPVLERQEVRDAGEDLLSREVARKELRKDSTGGSSGQPTEVWTGPRQRGWRESGREYFMRSIGVPAGSRRALLWGHHLDPLVREGARERVEDALLNVRWFDCLRLSPQLLERYDNALEEWRPKCITAYASSLASLAEHVKQRGRRPSYPTRNFVTGAEKLFPDQRRMIEETFGRPVHEQYGGRDVGLLGFQQDAPDSTVFAIDWATVLVEPEAKEPSSSVLVTQLQADAMPMLRYRVGDLARFPDTSAPGHPALQLVEVIGREADRIWLPDGGWVHGLSFPHLLKDHPVRDFQVVQREDRSVVLLIVPASGFDGTNRNGILNIIKSNLRGLPVELTLVESIPRTQANKRRPVISELRGRSGTGGV